MTRLISYPVIFISIILGFIFPQGKELKWLIPYLLAFILFIGFLKEDFKISDLKRTEIIAYGIISLILMPFFSFFVFKSFFRFDYRVGLFLIAIAPTGFSMTGLIDLLKNGDKKLVISNLFVFTLAAVVTVPVITYLFFKTKIEFDVPGLILKLCYLILVPWATSKIVHKFVSQKYLKSVRKYSFLFSISFLFILIYVAVASASESISINYKMSFLFLAVLAQYFVQAFFAYIAGKAFFKTGVETITVISASKNTQLALIVALINFGHASTIPCVLAIIGNHVTYSALLFFFHFKREKRV